MRKNTPSAAGDGDAADESVDGGRIEAMASSPSSEPEQSERSSAEGPVAAPDWTKRLSTRGKLARALIVALAVLVALVTLLPRSTFTLPPGIARLLTPAPTQTPLPGAFTTGPWEQISGPPVPAGTYYELAASPVDPLTAYTCALAVSSDATSLYSAHQAPVWITHDAGVSWAQASLPPITDTCSAVSPARDGSHRVTVSVDTPALDQNAQPCAHSQYFLSDDDGATWRRIQHTAIAPGTSGGGGCALWPTSHHLFMYTQSTNDEGHPLLERSDDDGRTWARADRGLAEQNAPWYPQFLDASGDTLGALVGSEADLWITRTAGVTWQRIGPIARETTALGTVVDLLSEVGPAGGPQRCRCAFAVAYAGSLVNRVGRLVFMSRDYAHWSLLPPLPAPGTSATHSGVYQVLGATADGRLLALGAEPSAGAVATPDRSGIATGPPPRLWAWDTRHSRWELAETRVPCPDLQSCQFYPTGASLVAGADGKTRGTTFWLIRGEGAGQSQPATFTFYRLFIPAD